jgi:hypothetical protein
LYENFEMIIAGYYLKSCDNRIFRHASADFEHPTFIEFECPMFAVSECSVFAEFECPMFAVSECHVFAEFFLVPI